MLHHISISAFQPKQVASVLAEILGGKAIPFPSCPGAYFALTLDDYGTFIEVLPAEMVMLPGSKNEEAQFVPTENPTVFGPVHAAISVAMDQERIEAIARREGWRCEAFSRGDGLFGVIELWIENRLLIELLPPALAHRYLEVFGAQNIGQVIAMVEQMQAEPVLAGAAS